MRGNGVMHARKKRLQRGRKPSEVGWSALQSESGPLTRRVRGAGVGKVAIYAFAASCNTSVAARGTA
jgi:hypothetical protein